MQWTPDNYDFITTGQDVGEFKDYDDVEKKPQTEPHTEMNHFLQSLWGSGGEACSAAELNGLCAGQSEMDSCVALIFLSSTITFTTAGSSLAFHEGRVRLSGGMECEGEVEVYFMQDWRRVLLDSWSESEASVVCRQLGCGSSFSFSSSSTSSPERSQMCVTGFNCSGSEAHLRNCSSAQAVNCSSREQLSVTCSEFKEFRLTEGCEGNLEVFYNGTWGNVCVNGMDEETTSLICQELNCGRTGSENQDQARVESAPNWLDDLKCRKHDSTLWHCPSLPWGNYKCNEVAKITCSDLSVPSTTTPITPTITFTTTVDQTLKRTTTPPQTLSASVPSIYSVSLLVLGAVLFLALVLLVVLFYQNRVLRRVLSRRRNKTLTEVVYEEIDRRYITKGNNSTQSGSILSEAQHSGYENVDEELLTGSIPSEEQHSGYEDVGEELHLGESAKEDTADSYDDVITAGQISVSVAEGLAEIYDDVITADQSSAAVTDYDDVEDEHQTEMNHVTERPQPVSFLGTLYSNLFGRNK
ncbi:hypothetical protein SRHO_G00002470 [Serrasalmus rhombeus]